MNSLRVSKSHFAIVLLCLALSFVLGASNLKSYPVFDSEANSIKHLWISHSSPTLSIAETVASVFARSPDHAPGYMVILNIWSRLTGRDFFTLRLLSVFFGLLALAFTFRLALLIAGADTAIMAALLAACLAYFVYYSYTARMYSLLAMGTAWVAWSYWKFASMEEPVPRRCWLNYICAAAAITWVHYFGLIVLAAIGVYHVFFARKTRRWLQISLASLAAGLLFTPLLPYFVAGTAGRGVPWSDALSLVDSARAIASIYTNGLPFLVPVAAIIAAVNYRRLGEAQKYILILAGAIALLMLAANEVAPLLIARRIRYTIIFAFPWACALAAVLSLLPSWQLLRIPFLILWIGAFAAYSRSDEMLLYTNWLTQNQHKMPHYQDLLYEPAVTTHENDYIVSFHPDLPLSWQYRSYYSQIPGKWAGLIHIWTAPDGIPAFYSSAPALGSAESMASWRFPVWLVYNPRETDLESIPAYADGFAKHYRSCGRYVDKPLSVIERYAPLDVSCALLRSSEPLAIQFDNGAELANIEIEMDSDSLNVYTWWARTDFGVYTYSLQVFERGGAQTGLQTDNLIGDSGFYTISLDASSLPAGEYVVKLIVYDTESLKSQPGLVVGTQARFQREVEVGGFSVEG